MIREDNVDALMTRMLDGDRRSLARILSAVEDERPEVPEFSRALAPHTGKARVLGITGAPGVGKSTTTDALVRAYREQGLSVAVLAVDPSSPFSGGALLGDRIRMVRHSADSGVYVRSMATRGHLGGLAEAVPAALRVLDAAGFDVIILETVGVGQSEVQVAGLADTVLVLLAPGMGDSIQAAKAGVLEIADVFVINKADHDGAIATARDLRHMISLGMTGEPHEWRPPVVLAVAERGEGIEEVVAEVGKHRSWATSSGVLQERRLRRASDEVEAIALGKLRSRLEGSASTAPLNELALAVCSGRLDPYAAAEQALAAMSGHS